MTELATIGHNNPPKTPYEEACEALELVHVEATNWLDGEPITSQEQADDIGRLINDIRAARKAADAARKAEAKPFDDGKKEVQSRYKPLLDNADTMVDGCKKLLAPFLAKIEAEKRAKAEEERRKADEARRKAEEAAREAEATDLAAREAAEMAIQEAKAAEAKAKRAENDKAGARGGGRAVTLREVHTPVIDNMTEVARHYWTTDRATVDDFFRGLVAKDVRAGKRNIPGVTVRTEQVAQ